MNFSVRPYRFVRWPAFALFFVVLAAGCFYLRSQAAAVPTPQTPVLTGDVVAQVAAGEQFAPQVARGGNNYLAVWADTRASLTANSALYQGAGIGLMHDIYAARLNAEGSVLDATPIVIAQAPYNQSAPHVAWNGSNWLVAWTTERATDRYFYDVLAVRVSPQGRVLDDVPITVSRAAVNQTYQLVQGVASDGANWLVTWSGATNTILGARIAPDGSNLDPDGRALRTASDFISQANVVFAADEYLLVWHEGFSPRRVFGQLLSPSLTTIGNPFAIGGTVGTINPNPTGLATDGTNFYVTWSEDSFAYLRLFGQRVAHNGQLTGSALQISPNLQDVRGGHAVTSDGTNFYVAYVAEPPGSFNAYLAVARINSNGTLLDPSGIIVDNGRAEAAVPAAASGVNGGAQIVWTKAPNTAGGSLDVNGAQVAANGAVGPESTIGLAASRQTRPRLAVGSNGYLTVFRRQNGAQTSIAAQRLNAEGTELDAEPLILATSSAEQILNNPAVAWNGSVYLVVWEDTTAAPRGRIFGKRIAPNGTVLDATPLALLGGVTPDLAALGENFLVVASDAPSNPQLRYVYGVRVNGAGTVLDATPARIGTNFDLVPRVAAVGQRWLTVWERHPTHDNPNSSTYYSFVNPDLTFTTPAALSGGTGRSTNATPHLAANSTQATQGTQAFVVWSTGSEIYGRRVAAEGTLAPLTVVSNAATGSRFLPAVAWDGAQFVATWLDQRNYPFPAQPQDDVYGARIDADGNLLDADGFIVAASSAPEETPFVVSDGAGRSLLAYAKFNDRAPYAAHRITLRAFPFDRAFAIYANPSGRNVVPGGSAAFTVNLSTLNNFAGSVAFSAENLPAGVTAVFNPSTLNGSGTALLTLNVASRTAEGVYRFQVVGSSGAQQSSENLTLTVANAPATSRYSVTDLGTLGGTTSKAYDINDAGVIVGSSTRTASSTQVHAFRWAEGVMQDLGTLGGQQSEASAINASGRIVGRAQNVNQDYRPFAYADGAMQDLGTFAPSGLTGTAAGINNSDAIVGAAEAEGRAGPRPFVRNPTTGALQDLGTFGGLYGAGLDINAAGHIAGYVSNTSGSLRAFYYNGTTKIDLGNFANANTNSYAYAVNDSDVVVGGAVYDPSWSLRLLPFRSVAGGALQSLGSLGGVDGTAYDINNGGSIVGYSTLANATSHAFLYENSTLTDLNTLIPADSGWVLTEAQAINNAGRIVGFGQRNGQTRAFLLTPGGSGTCTYSLTPNNQTFSAAAGSGFLHINAGEGCAWTATTSDNFITLASASNNGAGNGVIAFTLAANTGATRLGRITVGGQTFTIRQLGNDGGACNYSISPTSQSFTADGGTGTVNITAAAGCPWTAVSNTSWLNITSPPNGTGNGSVTFVAPANQSTSPLTGTLTVAGRTFTVTVAAFSCNYTLTPTSRDVPADTDELYSVNITTPANCPWFVQSQVFWLSVVSGGPGGRGNGTISYFVADNPTAQPRTGTILIGGQTHTVRQAGGVDCTYAVAPASRNFPTEGGSGSFNITAAPTCGWTTIADENWVQITVAAGGSGNATINYNVFPNNSGVTRTAHIDLYGRGIRHTIVQDGAGCTYTLDPVAVNVGASGGSGYVYLQTASGCPWTAQSNDTWINFPAAGSYFGPYPFYYSVAANPTTAPRTGTVSIAGLTFTVNQAGASLFQLSAATYSVNENAGSAVITVTRSVNTAQATSVGYVTADGTATQATDYTLTSGRLYFAAGETSKTFSVPIVDDVNVEGAETVNLRLRNPSGGILGPPQEAVLTITDNDAAPPTVNPGDESNFFVRQHYLDFLSRQPDDAGLQYWAGQLAQCGTNEACVRERRTGISAAFFIELEFQETGYFVYRFYRAAYGQLPSYAQFMPDRATVVGSATLEEGKQQFAAQFVNEAAFLARYPATLSGEQFIDALLNTVQTGSGVNLERLRSTLIEDYAQNQSRARVLRLVADAAAFQQAEYNRGFVLMQYFGYLRRDIDQAGYDFWLNILNQQPQNARGMVCAFLTSQEYQQRFSSVVTHGNGECGP